MGDQTEVFKMMYDDNVIDKEICFKLKDKINIRGHSNVLIKNPCRLDVWKYAFSHRLVTLWNKRLASCVNDTSVNMFKNRIDTYLQAASYIQLHTNSQ